MNEFLAAPDEKKDEKIDIETINEITQQHTVVVGVLQRRIGQIKVILNWWNKGDVGSAINALNMMNDMSVVMDVFNNTFAKGVKLDMLKPENICQVMPHATSLVNSKYETHIMAGLNSVQNIVS